MDGSRIRNEKVADLKISGYVLTGPKTVSNLGLIPNTGLALRLLRLACFEDLRALGCHLCKNKKKTFFSENCNDAEYRSKEDCKLYSMGILGLR